MGENSERGTGSWPGRTVVGVNWWERVVREEQGAGWADSGWEELVGESCERGKGSWTGRKGFGGNWWVRIVREEQGAGLGGQWFGGELLGENCERGT